MTSSVELKRQMTPETKKVIFLQAQMLVINFRIHDSYLKFLSVPLFLTHIEKLGIKISCTVSSLGQPYKSMECDMEYVGSPKISPPLVKNNA